jgi:hypothetical protein
MTTTDDDVEKRCLEPPLEKNTWKAACPECRRRVPGNLLVCPECGHDFRADAVREEAWSGIEREGLAYSDLADLALAIGRLTSVLGCVFIAVAAVVALLGGKLSALIWGPLGFFQSLAMYVVFVRMRHQGSDTT